MATVRKPFTTPEQYLELERQADFRSEYIAGEIYAMAGASIERGVIVANVTRSLANQLEDTPCITVPNDLKVQIVATHMYTYPDVVVVCGAPDFADRKHRDVITNPTLIVEVLSPSTESYDRGEKFAHYRHCASLREYILVAQDKLRIERFERRGDSGEEWLYTAAEGMDAVVTLTSVGCTLSLSDVYRRITFGEEIADAPTNR